MEKTGVHLLSSASNANNLCWMGLILKYSYTKIAVYYQAHIMYGIWSPAIILLGIFNDTSLFLSFRQIMRDPTKTNFIHG